MDCPILSEMQTQIYREVVRYAAGRAIFCPKCEAVMDCRRTVVATSRISGQVIVMCDICWARGPMLITTGPIEVLDGRMLWKQRPRKARGKRKVLEVQQ